MAAIYTTYDDVDNEIQNLAECIPAGKTDEVWVTAQIENAQQEIDGRLGAFYTVPFSTVPDIIKAIALYFTCSRILGANFVGEIPADSKWVDTYYNRGNALLKAIESGDTAISGIAASIDMPLSNSENRGRVFTQDMLDSEGTVVTAGTLEGI